MHREKIIKKKKQLCRRYEVSLVTSVTVCVDNVTVNATESGISDWSSNPDLA